MKDRLAEKILAKTLGWNHQILQEELHQLQVMSAFKYDAYQQFTNGKQFIESLALWLKRFDSQEDRQHAYSFIKENIVFISEREMQQLISVAYEEMIRDKIVDMSQKDITLTEKVGCKKAYQYYLRKTLFLGLSDGAHIDYFRRHNNFLNNEQVFMHYDFSEEKYNKMLQDLHEDLKKNFKDVCKENEKFNTFVLLDDFSGSGISYLRKDKNENTEENKEISYEWKGKIYTFIKNIIERKEGKAPVNVHIVLYIATHDAVENIKSSISECLKENDWEVVCTVQAVQYVEGVKPDSDIEDLMKKDYVLHNNKDYETFIDKHYRKGNVEKPYMGFNGCALPLVLYHNTPNNSFPVIWFGWSKKKAECLDHKEEALFPRVTRHRES